MLGDYRHPYENKGHRISVNGGLNKYSFLLTLLHEIAHLVTFIVYGNRVPAHGKEWKQEYSKILREFVGKDYLPPDVEAAVKQSLHNPAASSCADEDLMRVLKNYDRRRKTTTWWSSFRRGSSSNQRRPHIPQRRTHPQKVPLRGSAF